MGTDDRIVLLGEDVSEEQRMIADEVERIALALTESDGSDRDAWESIVALGVHALVAEDEHATLGDLVLVAEELGRRASADAFVWGAVASPSLLAALPTSAACERLRERIVAGELLTVALDASGDLEDIGTSVSLSTAGDRVVLDGGCRFVPLGADADLLLVVVRQDDGTYRVVAVEADARGVRWDRLVPLDLRSSLSDVRFDGALAVDVGVLERDPSDVLAAALLCQASAVAGTARQALSDSVEYSALRRQSGVPIASFQAIRHRLADMLVDVELMRAAIAAAASSGLPADAELAAYECFSAAPAVIRSNIQVHGGVGYTWEHSAHRLFRAVYAGRESVYSLDSLERKIMDSLMAHGDAVTASEGTPSTNGRVA